MWRWSILGAAKHEGLPEGSDGWRYVAELERNDDEPLIPKKYCDSFEETELESILSDCNIARVFVTGAQTDACIRSTLHGALARGYDTTLVGDAHTTEDMRKWGSPLSPEQAIAYTNMYWSFSDAPGRTCATVSTNEVEFAAD
jgi:isochorismate hydrolase